MGINVNLKWIDGFQFIARAENGPAVIVDSTESAGGPTPMQMLLIGIAGCTAMDVISILKKKRLVIADFQVNINGEQQADYPKRFDNITTEYIIRGKDIKPKAVEQAIRLSEEKFCSAMASVNARFENTYKIIDSEA